jgi:hypothetical protein
MAEEATSRIEGKVPDSGPANSLDHLASRFDAVMEPPPEEEAENPDASHPGPADSSEGEPAKDEDAAEAEEAEADEDDSEEAKSPDTLEDLARALGAKDDDEVGQYADLIRSQLRVPVKVNGETRRVTLQEALDGYSRTEDYRANNQKLSDEQRRFDDAVQQARSHVKEKIDRAGELARALEGQLMSDEQLDAILAQQGSDEYLRAKSQRDRLKASIGAVQTESRQANEQAQQEAAENYRRFIAEQQQVLSGDFPEITDPVKGKALRERWKGYLVNEGFSEKEIFQVADARMVRVFDKAMRFDDLQKAKPEQTKKLKSLPRVLKPGKGEKAPAKSTLDVAKAKLKRTGRPEDAAAAIMALIK